MSRLKHFIIGSVAVASLGGSALGIDAKINPYIDISEKFVLEVVSEFLEAGKSEIFLSKDKPEIRFKKWNGEIDLGITYSKVNKFGSRKLLTDKIEWKDKDEEIHAYPIENGFEIEIYLKKKPASNVFEFDLDGYEDLDFFYQSLSYCNSEGILCPENVIGSYAVYHKTKKNHITGQINYGIGKAYHIYRPKVIDDNGDEVWALLNYLNGKLTVTVSQKFLDNAKYPVIIDPTFGHTSIGGSVTNLAIKESSFIQHQKLGTTRNFTVASTLDKMSVAISMETNSDTVDTAVAMYREDSVASGQHGEVVVIERANLSLTTTPTWYDFTASDETLTADDYILTAMGDARDVANAADASRVHVDTASDRNVYFYGSTVTDYYDTMTTEDPWVESASVDNLVYSIYSTVTLTETSGSFTLNIEKDEDDGFCYSIGTALCYDSANNRLGTRDGANWGDTYSAFRFQYFPVPQGATISAATFTITGFDDDATTEEVKIWAEDVDDSVALVFTPITDDNTPKNKVAGSNSVAWTLPNQTISTEYTSPEIKTVIQEIIDRGGWAWGNSLTILIRDNGSTDNHNVTEGQAKLNITYTTTEASTSTPQSIFWFF